MAKLLRLDKFLCDVGLGTRTDAKEYLKKGLVTVNGNIQKRYDFKVNTDFDVVTCEGKELHYQEFYYYMLHKPAGVVSATEDKHDKTVIDLLGNYQRKDLFPVGRLDKDTEGLLLITNDGNMSHALLSPKKHVPKTYYVEIPEALTMDQIKMLEKGLDIGEEKYTLPAEVEIVDETHIHLTICEGKFHQVKRMLKAAGSEVLYLKRICFGSLMLDDNLEKGCFRSLTEEEISSLKDR